MKVKIRPLIVEDAYTSYTWRNDKEVFKYTGVIYQNEITLEMELEWIQNIIDKKNDYRCAILADDIYVGNIYLTEINKETANYHIFIGRKDYYNKGIAYKASKLIINYAKDILCLKYIDLAVRKKNQAAIALYLKLGFEENSSNEEFILMRINLNEHHQ